MTTTAQLSRVVVTEALRFDMEQKLAMRQALCGEDWETLLAIMAEDAEVMRSAEDERETAEEKIIRLKEALAELRKRFWTLQDENSRLRRTQRKFTVQIRPSTYRGKEGFTVSGYNPQGKRVKMFALSRGAAERIRDKVKAGQEVTAADLGSIQ